jgi:pimeloyl-ACP methyl ester carboxylesterase
VQTLVLVHGSWVDSRSWDAAVKRLEPAFHVVAYDRRGHGRSGPPRATTLEEHADDLIAILDEEGASFVAANSYGGAVALRAAARQPELVRALALHEPPLIGLVGVTGPEKEIVALIEEGEVEPAARRFVDVALGPGMWERFPPAIRQMFVTHAPNFPADAVELVRPIQDLDKVSAPVLLTRGDAGPPVFAQINAALAAALPHATEQVFPGAGHVPHQSHAKLWAETVTAFFTGTTPT